MDTRSCYQYGREDVERSLRYCTRGKTHLKADRKEKDLSLVVCRGQVTSIFATPQRHSTSTHNSGTGQTTHFRFQQHQEHPSPEVKRATPSSPWATPTAPSTGTPPNQPPSPIGEGVFHRVPHQVAVQMSRTAGITPLTVWGQKTWVH